MHVAGPYTTAPADVDRWVAARVQRQQRLTGPRPLRLHAVISEAALRLEAGGPAVMSAQLVRLLEAAESDNVTIQVLPPTAGAHPALASNFTVLHFATPELDPPLGYFDGPLGGYMIDDQGDVAMLINMFADLRAAVLTEADSAKVCSDILEAYR
ncbi:MAG: DUF5753 domain-containing protein [Carbonactinosporaceae bacterium]